MYFEANNQFFERLFVSKEHFRTLMRSTICELLGKQNLISHTILFQQKKILI